MTQWIITSSVLIVIIAVLRFVLRGKISLKLQYALWGLVLIRLLLPFSVFESPASVLNLIQKREETVAPPAVYEPYEPETVTPAIPDEDIFILDDNIEHIEPETNITVDDEGFVTEPEIRVISAKDILIPVWIGGIAVFGTVFAVSNLRFSKKLKNTREYVPGTKAWIPVYKSSAVKTPCLFGATKPAIYVTEEVFKDEKTICHVLEHETTHYRHGDHIWSVLRCFCLALHWYNPLVWLAAFLSMRDSELACDEDTIKRIGEDERIGYGRTLINLTCEKPAVGILSAATTMTGSKSSIKERILLIAKKPKMLWITAVLVAVIALIAVGCTFTGAVKYNPKTTENPVLETYSDHIFIDIEYSDVDKIVSMKVTDASSEEITTEVYNGTYKDVHYSNGYKLHFEQDGRWYGLPILDDRTTDMMFAGTSFKAFPDGKTSTWTNNIKESYGTLPDGKYRILRTFEYMGIAENSEADSFVLAAEFILEDGKILSEAGNLVPGKTYIEVENYQTSFSSWFGIRNRKYMVEENSMKIFETENSFDGNESEKEIAEYKVSEWKWEKFPYSKKEWEELTKFMVLSDIKGFPKAEDYSEILYQPFVGDDDFLVLADGELWFVDMNILRVGDKDPVVHQLIVLDTVDSLGKAYWEYAPAMSSKAPWFEFEFDFDFSKVSAGTQGGKLVDVDKPGFTSDYKVDVAENSVIQWIPDDEDDEFIGGAEKAEINFVVYMDDKEDSTPYWGKIVIEAIERENLDTIYEATLVSKDLYLRQNKETGGGTISFKSEGVIEEKPTDISVKKRYYRIYSEEELSAMTEEEYRTAARILGYTDEQLDYIEPFFEEGLTRAHVLMPLETSKEVSEKEQGARSERIYGTFYYDPELFGDYEGSLGFAYTIYRDRFKIIPEILSDSTVYGIVDSVYAFTDSEGVRFYGVERISGPYKTWKMPKIEGEQEYGYRQLGVLISENSGNIIIFYADIPEDFDVIYEGEEPDLSSTYQISIVNTSGYEIRFDTGINLMVEFEGLPDCVKPDYIRDDGETVLFTLGGKSYLYDYWNETITELSSGNTNLNSDDAALKEWVRNLKVTQNYRTDKPFPAAVGAVFNAIVNSEDIKYIDFKDVEVYGDEKEFFAAYTYIERGGEEQVLQVRMRKTAEGYGLLARGGGPLGYGLEKTDITMANINLFDIPHMSPVAGGLSVTLGTNGKYGLYKPDGTLAADFVYDSYDYCGSIIVLGKEGTKTRKYITEEHSRVTGIGEKASNEYYFYHYKTGELITDKYGEEYYYTETDVKPLTGWHDAFRFCENGNLYEYQYFTDDSRDEVTMTEFHRAGTIGKTLNGLEITRYHYGPYKESIRYGISTKKDTEIIPPIYTSIEAPFEDRFVARHDDMMVTNTTRIYDLKGRVICDKYDVISFSLFNGGSYVGVAECVGAESQAGTICFDENGKEMPQGLWFIDKDGNAVSERFDYSGLSTKVIREYDKITVRDFVENKNKEVSVKPYCLKNYETNLSKLKKAKKGDTVNFGYYHGETEWIVLDKEGDKLLLISKLSLDNKKFNDEYNQDVTWKTSDLRKWLNDEFIYEAFSQTERNLLVETTTTRNGAKDKVSLLSYSEAEKYFSTKMSRKTMPSEYAIYKVDFVPTESGGNTWFWLREGKAELTTSGKVKADGTLFDWCGMDNSGFIRPIVWIDISKIK